MQDVEGVEKFLLRTFLTYNKLYVIDHQHIHGTVFVAELCHGCRITATDGLYYFVGKFFGSDIEHLGVRVLFQKEMSDGMHKVGLAQPGSSVKVKRVVCFSGRFRYRKAGRMCKLVVASDYKGIEFIFGI